MISATICCSSSPFVAINLKGISPPTRGLSDRSTNNGVFVGNRGFCSTSTRVFFSRRPKPHSPITSSSSSKTDKRRKHDDVSEEDGIDEDALEAFFSQLEKDLNIDLSDNDCDEELSEEDLARLGKELEEAFADDDEEMFNSSDSEVDDDDNDDDEDGDEDDERLIKLKNWQLRRLASALKIGRRKTSIKSLAAELCLDRALVLELLRDPPPNLLLLSAALPDKVEPTNLELETDIVEPSPPEEVASTEEPEPEMNEPIHVMQRRWSIQKRLKKVQVETLERVYKRSKRPTNAMISSIVHVTNLPRKRIVQWFEEKRAEEGVPENRRPYHGSKSDTVFTNKSL